MMNNAQTIDFMMFSLLGVTHASSCEELVEASIRRAYRDAFSRVKSIEKEKRARLTQYISNEIMKNYSSFIDSCFAEQPFDCWHERTCKEITKSGNVSYGIAQKWVNMTFKYLLVIRTVQLEMKNNDDEFLNLRVFENSESFHIPVDGYIAEALCRLGEEDSVGNSNCGGKRLMPLKRDEDGSVIKLSKEVSRYANPYDSCIKQWSKWNLDDYIRFRQMLDKQYSLGWETTAWLLVARYRREVRNVKGNEEKGKLRDKLRYELKQWTDDCVNRCSSM